MRFKPYLLEKGIFSAIFGMKCIYTCCRAFREFWGDATMHRYLEEEWEEEEKEEEPEWEEEEW